MGSYMLRILFLLILFAVVNVHAEDNTVAIKEIDTQEEKSDDDLTDQETPKELTPEELTPDTFDPTEKIIEDISYDLPVDI